MPKIKAIYICVKNMDRAIGFYEDIFNTKVTSRDKRMSLFEFDNISFLLFDPSIDNEKIIYGNNIIPNIEVNNIGETLNLLKNKNCEIVMPLQEINKYQIFQTKDPEGNIIEFYQKKD